MSEKIFVTRATMPSLEEYTEEIKSIWDTHWLTNMGEKYNELERQLAKKLGVPYISLFSNGHMALELVLQQFGLTGEVITTPFTFASTTHAIVRNGLTPVFCDINKDDYTIDVTKIESLITDKTTAIVPVHVYGNICNVEEIERIAGKYGLKVIYDAAHAFNVTYKGIGVGNFGDASMFSFHATKVFNTIEGGAVAYKDDRIGKELYKLKNFGIKSEEEVDGIGANAKMNEFAAAMGLCNLRHLDVEIEKRKAVVEVYDSMLRDTDGLVTPIIQADVARNYAYYPIRIMSRKITRDNIFSKLAEKGIHARKYFYPLVQDYECYRDKYDSSLTPVAKEVSGQILTLPLYGELPLEIVEVICKSIINCFDDRS